MSRPLTGNTTTAGTSWSGFPTTWKELSGTLTPGATNLCHLHRQEHHPSRNCANPQRASRPLWGSKPPCPGTGARAWTRESLRRPRASVLPVSEFQQHRMAEEEAEVMGVAWSCLLPGKSGNYVNSIHADCSLMGLSPRLGTRHSCLNTTCCTDTTIKASS